jgi:hypothetical protein
MNLCPTASEAEKSQLPIYSPQRSDHDLPLKLQTAHSTGVTYGSACDKLRGL